MKRLCLLAALGGVLAESLFAPEDISIPEGPLSGHSASASLSSEQVAQEKDKKDDPGYSLDLKGAQIKPKRAPEEKEKPGEKSAKKDEKEAKKDGKPKKDEKSKKDAKKPGAGKADAPALPDAPGKTVAAAPPTDGDGKSVASSILGFFRGAPDAPKTESPESSRTAPSKAPSAKPEKEKDAAKKSPKDAEATKKDAGKAKKDAAQAAEAEKPSAPAGGLLGEPSARADPRKVKTVTVTEIRFVTVYHTVSSAPEGTHDVQPAADKRAPETGKTVSVGKAKEPREKRDAKHKRRAERREAREAELLLAEKVITENEKLLKKLRSEKESTKKKIADLEKKLGKLDKTIAVSKKEADMTESGIKERESEYDQKKKYFLKKKKETEQQIEKQTKALNSAAEAGAKDRGELELVKQSISGLQDREKGLDGSIKALEKSMKSSARKAASGLKKGAKEEQQERKKAEAKGAAAALLPGSLSSAPRGSALVHSSSVVLGKQQAPPAQAGGPKKGDVQIAATKDVKGEKSAGDSRDPKNPKDKKERSKATGSGTECTEECPAPEGEKKLPANNPLVEASANTSKFPIPPFAQNFSNGHLVVSGTPVTSSPEVLAKTQKLFRQSLTKAVQQAKAGEKTLAFWGYITSMFAQGRNQEK